MTRADDRPAALDIAEGRARAGVREWAGLAVLTLPVLLVSMDMTVLHLAIPAITADLNPTSTELLWIVDIYGFVVAALLITMGVLGDRIGRRRLLLVGAAGFAVASIAAAFAPTPAVLIAARAALGIAGATLAPSTLSLIRTMFTDPKQRSTAVSVWVLTFLGGGAIGPILGGIILQVWWWGAVFLLAVPVMVLLLIAGPLLLPEWRNPAPGRLDLTSVALSVVGLLAFVYAVKELAAHGPAILPIITGVAGVLLAVVFVLRQRRLTDPLLDVALLKRLDFSVAIGVLTLGVLVLAGTSFLTAQYLQLVLGLDPLVAGMWTLPPLAAGIAAVMLTQTVARRVPALISTGIGLLIAAAGLVVLTQAPLTGVAVVVIGLALLFAGVMPALAAGVDTVTAAAPPERAGAAAPLSETTQELGGSLGIALLGSLATLVYRQQLQPHLEQAPAGTAGQADTLAGALEAGPNLPDGVVDAAVEAFVAGLHAGAAAGAALLAAGAIATFALRLQEVRHNRSVT